MLGAALGRPPVGEGDAEYRPLALRKDAGDDRRPAVDRRQRIADLQLAHALPAGARAHLRVERLRLAHRRPRRQHDQVARLQAGGHAVEVVEARAHAGDFLGAVLVQLVDAVDQLHDQLVHALEALPRARALLADLEDLALGLVEDLRHRPALRIEGRGGDLVAGGDQLAQDGALAHDLGVAAQVGRAGHALRQRVEVHQPAAVLGLAEVLQVLEDGDDVGRPAGVDQAADGGIDQAVLEAVEVAVGEQVAGAVPGAVVEHQPADDALLGLDRLRRHAQPRHLVVARG